VQLLDETDTLYNFLLDRIGKEIAQGKSLNEIKRDPNLPEYKSWSGEARLDSNIEAASGEFKKSRDSSRI
jgi:hypothetical protein